MLINAVHPAEVRYALLANATLEEFGVEVAEQGLTRGNIYYGFIANIEPSLNAAFIEYGADRHGFLAIQDVVPDAYYHDAKPGQRPRIEDVLERKQPIVVQVTREPEGSKGAVLTTNLSLAGRYLVLTPFDAVRGVSRKVEDEETRRRLKQQAAKLEVPKGCGVIVRTNALDQSKTALNRDLAALLRLWKRIHSEAMRCKQTKLLYSDQDLVLQALRDYLDASVEEVLVDDEVAYAKAEQYMRAFMPRSKTKLIHYTERTPLFSRYYLERQIDRVYERRVELPSGGSLVIDATEALTAIDVNSGKSRRSTSQEETALKTNLEAATEVARQLRLRDIGGLVVVDFIDMRSRKNQRSLEKELRDAMKADKARSTIGQISPNGLLEINRQRLTQSLPLRTQRPCPTCSGTGRIASSELVGLRLLRTIEARAAMGDIRGVRIALHPELADAIQNDRRREIAALEDEFGILVEVTASPRLHRPEREIEWVAGEAKKESPAAPVEPLVREKTVEPAKRDSQPFDMTPAPSRAKAAEPAEAETAPGTRSRRRRRGGRRRSASREDGAGAPAKDAGRAQTAADRDDGASKAAESGADTGEGAARPAKKRRRRPRRRKKSASAASAGASAETDGAAQAGAADSRGGEDSP
jgi:ribonuclease E